MKITDPEVIKNGEKDLIASVHEDLDREAVKKILKARLSAAALAAKGGQIVVHDNEIAFRLDFEVNLSGSLLFDRDGNFIDVHDDQEDGIDGSGFPDPDAALDLDLDDDDIGLPDPDGDLEDTGAQALAPDDGLTDDLATDDLTIDLPDYDLDDDPEDALDSDEDLEIGDLEEDDDLLLDTGDELDLEDDDDMLDDTELIEEGPKDLDDDINDILKESRDFWEQKKDS